LQSESWLLSEAFVDFQAGLIGTATLNDRGEFITALLDLEPAAGMGNISRVKRWFDESGVPSEQRVLDTALAFHA
jgi:hypothetical protein